MPGKGEVHLTGKMGDVSRNRRPLRFRTFGTRDELRLEGRLPDADDVHVHLPKGAVPKDGPAMGLVDLSCRCCRCCAGSRSGRRRGLAGEPLRGRSLIPRSHRQPATEDRQAHRRPVLRHRALRQVHVHVDPRQEVVLSKPKLVRVCANVRKRSGRDALEHVAHLALGALRLARHLRCLHEHDLGRRSASSQRRRMPVAGVSPPARARASAAPALSRRKLAARHRCARKSPLATRTATARRARPLAAPNDARPLRTWYSFTSRSIPSFGTRVRRCQAVNSASWRGIRKSRAIRELIIRVCSQGISIIPCGQQRARESRPGDSPSR